jgi:hypothetical protein
MLKLAPGQSANSYATWQDATRISQRGFKSTHFPPVWSYLLAYNTEGGDVGPEPVGHLDRNRQVALGVARLQRHHRL